MAATILSENEKLVMDWLFGKNSPCERVTCSHCKLETDMPDDGGFADEDFEN